MRTFSTFALILGLSTTLNAMDGQIVLSKKTGYSSNVVPHSGPGQASGDLVGPSFVKPAVTQKIATFDRSIDAQLKLSTHAETQQISNTNKNFTELTVMKVQQLPNGEIKFTTDIQHGQPTDKLYLEAGKTNIDKAFVEPDDFSVLRFQVEDPSHPGSGFVYACPGRFAQLYHFTSPAAHPFQLYKWGTYGTLQAGAEGRITPIVDEIQTELELFQGGLFPLGQLNETWFSVKKPGTEDGAFDSKNLGADVMAYFKSDRKFKLQPNSPVKPIKTLFDGKLKGLNEATTFTIYAEDNSPRLLTISPGSRHKIQEVLESWTGMSALKKSGLPPLVIAQNFFDPSTVQKLKVNFGGNELEFPIIEDLGNSGASFSSPTLEPVGFNISQELNQQMKNESPIYNVKSNKVTGRDNPLDAKFCEIWVHKQNGNIKIKTTPRFEEYVNGKIKVNKIKIAIQDLTTQIDSNPNGTDNQTLREQRRTLVEEFEPLNEKIEFSKFNAPYFDADVPLALIKQKDGEQTVIVSGDNPKDFTIYHLRKLLTYRPAQHITFGLNEYGLLQITGSKEVWVRVDASLNPHLNSRPELLGYFAGMGNKFFILDGLDAWWTQNAPIPTDIKGKFFTNRVLFAFSQTYRPHVSGQKGAMRSQFATAGADLVQVSAGIPDPSIMEQVKYLLENPLEVHETTGIDLEKLASTQVSGFNVGIDNLVSGGTSGHLAIGHSSNTTKPLSLPSTSSQNPGSPLKLLPKLKEEKK